VVRFCLRFPYLIVALFVGLLATTVWLFSQLPSEYAPREDRGAFFVMVNGPEGASYAYMKEYMDEIERRLMPYTQTGEITRLLLRAPRAFGNTENFNSGIVISVLDDWARRRSGFDIINAIGAQLADLPGVRASPACAPSR
jgi:multidrug efflux pump